jgi:hypothetical protein
MGLLSGNSCNIITILPMGLDCDSIDASTPESTNGFVALYITGGTPPYTVTWDNGQQGTFLSNLLPGEYTATVVDYYGDFTATTTCVVGFESFYLEEFENCKDSSKVYYLADLPSTFEVGKIYELTTQAGCWISSGITLYNTQTYINNFAQVESGPYNGCEECDPPTPPIVYPSKLCITYGDGKTFVSIEANSGNTINGYPSWSASPSNQVIYYNTGTTRWEISGWTQSGVPVFNSPTAPPVGSWTILGTYFKTLTIIEGDCPPPPLSMRISNNSPTCSTTNDGSIVAFPIGGTPPYTYSLDGTIYQISNTFTNLIAGTYTLYVKDFNNTILSESTVLTPQETFQNYTINLTPISQTTNTVNTTETRTYTFKIEVTPQLPATKTLSFVLPINILITGNTTTIYSPTIQTTQISSLTFSTNGTATMTGPSSTSTPITNSTAKPLPCRNTNINTSAYTQNYQGTITGSGNIIGTLIQELNTPTVSYEKHRCGLNAGIKNVIGITNQNLTPSSCSYLNSAIQPLTYEFYKTGISADS